MRNLKAQKASKGEIDNAVKVLLALKGEYKAVTNTDWKPGCQPPSVEFTPPKSGGGDSSDLCEKITAQGDKVILYQFIYLKFYTK